MNKKSELIIDEEFKNLIPPLSNEEFEGLKKSIVDEGCRDPIVLWDDTIIDGHNRFKICSENGIIFKRVVKNFDNKDDAKVWILDNQLGRRNLNDAQRIDIVDKLFGLKEQQDAEYRMKHPTANLPEGSKGERRDKLGNKAKVSGKQYSKGIKIKDEQPELWTKCIQGELSIDKAYKEVNQLEKQKERDDKSEQGKNIELDDDEIDLRYGDFIEVLDDIPDNSIDLILTDPPYPIDFIEEWKKLGVFAEKKLKPNGFLVAYCGHKNLYESMKRLGEHLDFYWIFSLVHSGTTKLIAFNNIEAGWKPILIYQNGFKKYDNRVKDIITGTGRNKKNHDWEQSDNELVYLLESFSRPGDMVADPFAGSGTTLIMCKKNKRICYGAEVDEKTFNLAKKRISDEIE
jgi:hypothetical protein